MKVKGFLTSLWSDTFGRVGHEGCSLQDFQIDLMIFRAGWEGMWRGARKALDLESC